MGLDHTTYLSVYVEVSASNLIDVESFNKCEGSTTLAQYLAAHFPIENATWRAGTAGDMRTGKILMQHDDTKDDKDDMRGEDGTEDNPCRGQHGESNDRRAFGV